MEAWARSAGKSGRQRPSPIGVAATVTGAARQWVGTAGAAYCAFVDGLQMAEDFPVVSLDAGAREAVELLAARRLPALIVVDEKGRPHSVLPASQVAVPGSERDNLRST